MQRITQDEWRLISRALSEHQLGIGDDIQLHRDQDRPADAERAERECEAIGILMGKVRRRIRANRREG